MALQPLVLILANEIPSLTENAWFLDDGVLGGNHTDLQRAVDILNREGPERGLHLSLDKSQVWSQKTNNDLNDDPLDRGIPLVRNEGIKLLGAGNRHFRGGG